MRRLFGVLLTGAILLILALSPRSGAVYAQDNKLTFDAESVVWMMAVKPDKTADFEAVMAALKDALSKSTNPQAKEQLAGWKISKLTQAQPDGSIVYVHLINPVVKGADYGIMANIYPAVEPAMQKELYDKYTGALNRTLMQAQLNTVMDFSK